MTSPQKRLKLSRPVLSEPFRVGSAIWDCVQTHNTYLEREKKIDHPSFLTRDVWQIIGDHFANPFVVDIAPPEDVARIKRGIDTDLLDALLSVPGVFLAGGSTLPGLRDDQYDDIDIFVHSPMKYFEDIRYALFGYLNEIKEFDENADDLRILRDVAYETCTEYRMGAQSAYLVEYTHMKHIKRKIQLVLRESPSVVCEPNCILYFAFDYQQCAFRRTKDGVFMRYRTRASILAHETKIIRCMLRGDINRLCKARKLLVKANKKGYRLPANITDVRQLGSIDHIGVAYPVFPDFSIESIIAKTDIDAGLETIVYQINKNLEDSPPKWICFTPLEDFMNPDFYIYRPPRNVAKNDEMATSFLDEIANGVYKDRTGDRYFWTKPSLSVNGYLESNLRQCVLTAMLGGYKAIDEALGLLFPNAYSRMTNHQPELKAFVEDIKKWLEEII